MMVICSVEGCERKAKSRGWCETHYMRWYHNGTVELKRYESTCTVEGCERGVRARGLCVGHYARWAKTGSVLLNGDERLSTERTVAERFWSKVDFLSSQDGCWLWLAATTRGYGMFKLKEDGRTIGRGAHRTAWMLTFGHIPDSMTIDHRRTCPKNCVNPDHLRLCSLKQNKENADGAYSCSKSGLRGVYECPNGKYSAQVRHHGKLHRVGTYATAEEAAEAARFKRLELFTHSDMDKRKATT